MWLAHGAAGGRGVNLEELEHVRADVRQAILEAQQHDPTVALEILWRLFDSVAWANVNPGTVWLEGCAEWTDRLLRDVQARAVSKVQYGETPAIEQEDHRDQPRA